MNQKLWKNRNNIFNCCNIWWRCVLTLVSYGIACTLLTDGKKSKSEWMIKYGKSKYVDLKNMSGFYKNRIHCVYAKYTIVVKLNIDCFHLLQKNLTSLVYSPVQILQVTLQLESVIPFTKNGCDWASNDENWAQNWENRFCNIFSFKKQPK